MNPNKYNMPRGLERMGLLPGQEKTSKNLLKEEMQEAKKRVNAKYPQKINTKSKNTSGIKPVSEKELQHLRPGLINRFKASSEVPTEPDENTETFGTSIKRGGPFQNKPTKHKLGKAA